MFANIFFTYQTFVTNLHVLTVELRCKLQEKLHRVTGPLIYNKLHATFLNEKPRLIKSENNQLPQLHSQNATYSL